MKNLPEWIKLLKGDLKTDDGDVDMLISEPIGFDPETFSGMDAKSFGYALASVPKGKKVNLMINTLGGLISEGVTMYNMILARGNVNTTVIGYAASIGAVIFQAGNKRTMMPGTMCLIHDPMSGAQGTASEVAAVAATLKVLKSNIVDLLASRTGQGKKAIAEMMTATTAMGPSEALKLGFCDEVIDGSPAWNDINPSRLLNFSQQLASTRMSAIAGGGSPPKTENTETHMQKLMQMLARLKLIPSADLTDEAAAAAVENNLAALENARAQSVIVERDSLKTKLTAHENALKLRVENRVAKAIENKLIKAERKDALVASGLANETSLDFIDDLAPAGGAHRGSPPLPGGAAAGETQTLDQVRAQMAATRDPKELAELALKARELRGQKNLFTPDSTRPAFMPVQAAK